MAYLKTYEKHPADRISFDIPFAKLLALPVGAGGLAGDPIASFSTPDVTPGMAVVDAALIGADIVRVTVVGGKNSAYYTVATDVTTAGGRKKHGEIRIRVRGAGIPAPLPIDGGNVGDLTDLTPIDGGEL